MNLFRACRRNAKTCFGNSGEHPAATPPGDEPSIEPNSVRETAPLGAFVGGESIECRVTKLQMGCQSSDDFEYVGQFPGPVLYDCVPEFSCFLEEFGDQRLLVLVGIQSSKLGFAARRFDDRRDCISYQFAHA